MDKEAAHSRHTQRDREGLTALGLFLVVLSLPVLAGTFWADSGVAAVINVVAGLAVLGVGAGMVARGRWPVKE
jgi:hypothetical protein